MSDHPIVHIEFSAVNREILGKFYAELFGWHVQQIPEMNYATFETHAGVGGGFNPVTDSNPPGTVIAYVETDDIDVSLAKVTKLGGKTLAPMAEIPGVGWFAIFADPSGNKVGLLKQLPGQQS